MRPIVVDTNIIFSALLREQSQFLQLLLDGKHDFFVCELILMELFKHKEKIVRLTQLSENEIIKLYYLLLKRLHVYKEGNYSLYLMRASVMFKASFELR